MPLTKVGKATVLAGIIVLETIGVGSAYLVWTKCNNSSG